jgi:hypothetical protein
MNFSNILSEIEKLDPEVYERTSPRRSVIKNWTRTVGLTALPFALGSLFNKAYGKNTDIIVDTLNFALTLEYLESEFYKAAVGNAANIGITGAALTAITTIKDHEVAHVTFLTAAVTAAGGTPVTFTAANFDFSGGSYTGGPGNGNGAFKTALTSDYNLFLAVAQTFEDTGVRAYKGQAANLASSHDYLTAALQIHSVEARHAAHIRRMRAATGTGGGLVAGTVKPWITGNMSGINSPAVQPSYNGEDNTMQLTVQASGLGGKSQDAATESFDEPLDKATILTIVDPFIV